MLDEVKLFVDAKINIFAEYFSIPKELEDAVSKFARDTTMLGESCGSAAEFEENFVASGLSERFNSLLPKCTPKARKMTKEEKKNSVKIAGEILSDNKKEIAQDAARDLAEQLIGNQRDKQLTKNRERMIADGTYAENTIRKNKIDAAVSAGRFLKNFLKK